jgi:YebC/PmpR family DNA-binding regulatory protein
MSGHSKWSTIKRKKGKTDAARGKIFTKLGREIAVAVKSGGADPEANVKLKDVIAKAKANNMPGDNIQRCVKKAAGEFGGENYEEIVYEGYGPSGVAVIVETLTDNRNRTAGDVRHYFDKFGGKLGQNGCVGFLFETKGVLIIDREAAPDEDAVTLDAIEAGADDFTAGEDAYEILASPESFSAVRGALEEKGYAFLSAEIERVPTTDATLTDEKDILMMNRLIEHLEDSDDVQNVYHNWGNPS